ncbi:Caspase-like domain superfamily [Sesbania bispinosa]|nr:Caspase-like domain superfamily [Sesbania bispinosa]
MSMSGHPAGRGGYNNKDIDSGKQMMSRGFVNLNGQVIGNGNGNVYIYINHVDRFNYPRPCPWEEKNDDAVPFNYPTFTNHQPWPLRLLRAPPNSTYYGGNKRAVLFGISYHHQRNSLKDDPEERNPGRIPTKRNMLMAMRWLVEGCQPGDSLVFYFYGHGEKVLDRIMDKIDGFSEAICPVDHEAEGKILDDEINATIVRPLPHRAKLHALVDATFSATILDLPFMCRMDRKGYCAWEDRHLGGYKGPRGGLAVSISTSDGLVADTSVSGGSLTYSFIQVMEDQPNLTYGRLINAMRSLQQDPQLSSSDKFDIYSKSIVM